MKSDFSYTISPNPLLEAYMNTLSRFKWTIFLNVSFRKECNAQAASSRLKWFLKHLNTPNILVVDKYCHCTAFFEKQNTRRGGVHIHALIDRINPDYYRFVEGKARRTFGRWSIARPFVSDHPYGGAIRYMATLVSGYNPIICNRL